MLGLLDRSLGAKIIFWVSIALMFVLGFTTWFNIAYQTSNSKAQVMEAANLTTHSMMESLKALMLGGNQDLVQQAVSRVGQDLAGLSVVDWEGVVRRSGNDALVGHKFQLQGFDIQEVLKGKMLDGMRKGEKGKIYYTQLLPITAEKACYQCHESTLPVIGAIQVDLDWTVAQGRIDKVRNSNLISSISGLIIIIVLLIIMLTLMMVRPIDKLIVAANDLSSRAGDLTQKIAITTKDEIGRLAQAFNRIIDSMHDMVFQIRNTAEKTASSAQELSSSTQEMNASTQEISTAVQQVAKGATTQAERIEETFEIMEKASIALKQMVANAQSTTAAANQTTSRAETGRQSAQEAADKIGKLAATVTETTQIIQGLGEKSQQIGEITETITSIADQTNLLALNAAIEAARAGEAGRGFAVVAEEVRKLAESSAEAVRKIGGLIKSIQTETGKAVDSIEVSAKEVQEGRSQVSKIGDILNDINKAAKEANLLANEIAIAGQTQSQESERVVKAINEVAAIAKEFASTSEEVSSSTEEQTASMEEMAASAQELARISMDLKDLVGKFKLRSEEEKAGKNIEPATFKKK